MRFLEGAWGRGTTTMGTGSSGGAGGLSRRLGTLGALWEVED